MNELYIEIDSVRCQIEFPKKRIKWSIDPSCFEDVHEAILTPAQYQHSFDEDFFGNTTQKRYEHAREICLKIEREFKCVILDESER